MCGATYRSYAGPWRGRRPRRDRTASPRRRTFPVISFEPTMFSIDLECRQSAKDMTIANLWEAGCSGIVEVEDREDAARLRAFFDDDALQPELLRRFGGEASPADTR